jgi:hypothetical protein
MRYKLTLVLGMLLLTACSGSGSNQQAANPAAQPGTSPAIQNPPTENPAPQTGTGGETQSNPPANQKQ